MAEEQDQSEPRTSDAETSATASADDGADRVVAAVNDGVERVLRAFDEKIRYDESKQQAIDRQHEELVDYRRDIVARAAAPFIYGMIHHHAEIGKLLKAVQEEHETEMPSAKACDLLESLQEDVEQVLGENGVEAYRPEVAEPFDPVRQTVVGKTQPTEEETRSGTIAACLRPGFEREGRILVKAQVSAYRYAPPVPDS